MRRPSTGIRTCVGTCGTTSLDVVMLVIDWRLRYRRQGWILGEYCRCGSMASRLLVLRNHGFLVLSVSRTLMWKVLLTAVDLASCLVILVSFKCLEKFGVVMRLDEMWLEEDILYLGLKSSIRYLEGMIYSYVTKSNDAGSCGSLYGNKRRDF